MSTLAPYQTPTISRRNQTRRKFAFALWLLLLIGVLAAWWFPISFATLRAFQIIGTVALWLGAIFFVWNFKAARIFGIAVIAIIAILLLAPGREYSRAELRSRYIACLETYEGAPYVWGGECKRGIDCSGLVRRGMIDANFQMGFATLNPKLLHAGANLWWHDSSAKAMMEEYRRSTRVLFPAKSLNAMDYGRIEAGDFAVTQSGVHTLAYIGNRTWIEADPGPMRVIQVRVPTKNAWFSMPMKIVRWRELEENSKRAE